MRLDCWNAALHIPFYIFLIMLALSYIDARPQSGLVSHVSYIGSGDLRLEEMSTTVAKALYKDEEAIDATSDLGVVTGEDDRNFLRIKVKKDGDCFAYAIGSTRDTIIKALEKFVDNIQKSSTAPLSAQLLSSFSTVFSFIHKHPSVTTVGDLESLLLYDFSALKAHIKQLSQSIGIKDLESKFIHLEKTLKDTQKDENMPLLSKLEILKKEKGSLRNSALDQESRLLEKCLDELKVALKTTFPHLYNLFNYRKFLSILAVALSKKPPVQKFTKEISAIKRNLEKGSFKKDAFPMLKKLVRVSYAKNEEIMIGDTKISSQNAWFDLELLPILEDSLDLNCVVIVDKSSDEDERKNKIQIKPTGTFNTEPRYIYYTNRNHFDLLVPFVNQHPFPSPIKVPLSIK